MKKKAENLDRLLQCRPHMLHVRLAGPHTRSIVRGHAQVCVAQVHAVREPAFCSRDTRQWARFCWCVQGPSHGHKLLGHVASSYACTTDVYEHKPLVHIGLDTSCLHSAPSLFLAHDHKSFGRGLSQWC